MSSLSEEVRDLRSPVTVWMRKTFPHHQGVQAGFRLAAGEQLLVKPPDVAASTQGSAIDWWLRMLVDDAVSLTLPRLGLLRRGPWLAAGTELLADLASDGQAADAPPRSSVMRPARFSARSDEWWARVSYALALLAELYRALSVTGSRLMQLTPTSTSGDLLALANDAEVADLIAMKDLATENLFPLLSAGPVATGMTFEGSQYLNADADLIVDGTLVDFKAGQGRRPRLDGRRTAKLDRSELDQLLGYALLDYDDEYKLHTVAVYAARYGYLAAWPLTKLCNVMAGRQVDLAQLRSEFAGVLRRDLPRYWSSSRTRRLPPSAVHLERRRSTVVVADLPPTLNAAVHPLLLEETRRRTAHLENYLVEFLLPGEAVIY
ncbi:hypothetical protein OG394_29300 [Kribbella sp. NBC_01245]|uniref:hypothetical protein n=1 Tax=Kribbella sp. NBC_01245 TaxID=2903578 RepID=UPI002E2B580E|nr:hypothetical protein [Kribbella sp. NBC_01245]